MKKISIISLLAIALLFGCTKNEIKYGEFELVDNSQSFLKINFASIYSANPGVQFTINGTRVSNLLTARTPFPGGGYNTGGGSTPDYLAVKPGALNFKVSIPQKNTNIDSVVLFSTDINVTAGDYNTLHITDTAANTQSVLTSENRISPDSGYAKFRVINLMPNVPAIDLYYGTTLVASNVQYKQITDYFTMAVPATALEWRLRPAGAASSSTPIAVLVAANSAPTTLSGRSYTAFAMGYSGQTSTSVRRPFISFFLIK
jgi:hypothetical protein